MEWLLGAIIVVLLFFIVVVKLTKKTGGKEVKIGDQEKLPYKVANSILTHAELSFYHTLQLSVGDKTVICPKVGLKDIFFISKGIGKDYMKYFGKIAQKHVDFLLCDRVTMEPLCGIELDDISHTSKKGSERDLFVEKVYRDANFKLIRISAKSGYTLTDIEVALAGVFEREEEILTVQTGNEGVLCPKCGTPMVLRKATKGPNAGKEFYGCVNYPKCKEVVNQEVS